MWTFKGKEILAIQTVCGKHVDGYYSLSAKPGIASTDNENIHCVLGNLLFKPNYMQAKRDKAIPF